MQDSDATGSYALVHGTRCPSWGTDQVNLQQDNTGMLVYLGTCNGAFAGRHPGGAPYHLGAASPLTLIGINLISLLPPIRAALGRHGGPCSLRDGRHPRRAGGSYRAGVR
jgi:hypothetical protein